VVQREAKTINIADNKGITVAAVMCRVLTSLVASPQTGLWCACVFSKNGCKNVPVTKKGSVAQELAENEGTRAGTCGYHL